MTKCPFLDREKGASAQPHPRSAWGNSKKTCFGKPHDFGGFSEDPLETRTPQVFKTANQPPASGSPTTFVYDPSTPCDHGRPPGPGWRTHRPLSRGSLRGRVGGHGLRVQHSEGDLRTDGLLPEGLPCRAYQAAAGDHRVLALPESMPNMRRASAWSTGLPRIDSPTSHPRCRPPARRPRRARRRHVLGLQTGQCARRSRPASPRARLRGSSTPETTTVNLTPVEPRSSLRRGDPEARTRGGRLFESALGHGFLPGCYAVR